NVGLLEDTGPAGLLLRSSTVINAGTISASGTQTSVSLQSASITGGVLQDAGGGVIVAVDRGSEIDSVALSIGSNLHIANNNYLTIAGSITNRGTIYEDSVGNDTRLIASGSVRLSGGGVVQLSNNGANLISGNPGSVLLNVNDTIQGAGQIGDGALSLTNGAAGTIDATGNSNVLVLTGLATTNAGLIEGTGGAGLRISSTTIDNSGTIAALVAGSNVQLFSATVVGGTLATANGGVIYQVDRGSVLNTVTLASGSLLDVTNNSFLTLAGTLTNLGTVTMSSGGSDTRLIAAGTVTLTGGGLLQLSDNSDNGLVASGVARFVNQNNVISGGGFIGDGGDPNLSFDNETAGVIDASAGNALRIVLDGGTLTNTGTIEATATSGGNGGLQIISSTIDNTGSNNAGVILATGTNSHVNLQSASILGGTLATASGGVIDEVDRGSVLNDVTVATSGRFDVLNNTFLTLAGTLANLGTVTMS